MKKTQHAQKKKGEAPDLQDLKARLNQEVEKIFRFCTQESQGLTFLAFEKKLIPMIGILGCIFIKIFLVSFHQNLSLENWLKEGAYRVKKDYKKSLKTAYGTVTYYRDYLYKKNEGGGFFPLDAELGITNDGFSPLVISLACRLATRVSYASAVHIFRYFLGWAPSTEAVEFLVLGLGKETDQYMESTPSPKGDGEVLVIEIDGKATPTATIKELSKRRRKRKQNKSCNCKRHRGKKKRIRYKRNRRKKGDKSKNGRSITLVAMYTLKKGNDDQLHGPINKKVWGSYAPRKVMFEWARRQATKRGFPSDTKKKIEIVIDGEKCLQQGMEKLFPNATFTLDIRHMEEKLWKTGRAFYKEGSEDLDKWVEKWKRLLYKGKASKIVTDFGGDEKKSQRIN